MLNVVQHGVDLTGARRRLVPETAVAAHTATDQASVPQVKVIAAAPQRLYEQGEQQETGRRDYARYKAPDFHAIEDNRVDVESARRHGDQFDLINYR